MTRTRARADERNEKTDSITRERRRIRDLETEVAELRAWKAERLQEDKEEVLKIRTWKEKRLQEEEEEEDTEEERRRLADLLERLAEFVGDHGRGLEYGEGKSWTLVTDDDLLRAAEMIDPDD